MLKRILAIGAFGVLLFASQAWADGMSFGVDGINPATGKVTNYAADSHDRDCAYVCVDATGKIADLLTFELSEYTGEKLQCKPGETLKIFNRDADELQPLIGVMVKQDEYLESIAPPRTDAR